MTPQCLGLSLTVSVQENLYRKQLKNFFEDYERRSGKKAIYHVCEWNNSVS